MKSASKKRSTKAINLLLVSSAFILEGCSARPVKVPPQTIPPNQDVAQAEVHNDAEFEQPLAGQPVQTMPPVVNHSKSGTGWSYMNPFFWGNGSGYGRSWSSSGSSNASRFSTGSSGIYSGSGPASHFGAQNSVPPSARISTSNNTPTVHVPTTHTSTPHSTSSPSVSRGGFGGHSSSASS